MPNFVEEDLLLMHGGESFFVDDEVLGLGLDKEAVGAADGQGRGHYFQGPATELTQAFAEAVDGQVTLRKGERTDPLFASPSEAVINSLARDPRPSGSHS
ncbi:hypothetical protein P354_13945 [Streptomyces noursei PD-1]|nr:hypothetical protein P354_13945 [Streptomyces noursei PD-1]